MKKIIFALIGTFLFAHNVNLQLTNATLLVNGEFKISSKNIKLRGSFLYNDNENKHNFFSLGIKAEGNLIGAENTKMKFSLFVDGVHTKDNTALPIGIGIFSYIPGVDLPFYVNVEGEYAPKVLSFDDADRFSRIDGQVGYFPISNAKVFVGYRHISFNKCYNSAVYGGVGISF